MVIRMSTLSIGQTARPRDRTLEKLVARGAYLAKLAWRAHRSFLVLCAEIVIAAASYFLAIYVLSETHDPGWAAQIVRATFGFLILFRLAGLVIAGLYRRSLRYASIPDLISICKIVIFSTLTFWAFAWWQLPELKLPFALFVLDCMILQLLWGSLHFGSRILKTQRRCV